MISTNQTTVIQTRVYNQDEKCLWSLWQPKLAAMCTWSCSMTTMSANLSMTEKWTSTRTLQRTYYNMFPNTLVRFKYNNNNLRKIQIAGKLFHWQKYVWAEKMYFTKILKILGKHAACKNCYRKNIKLSWKLSRG